MDKTDIIFNEEDFIEKTGLKAPGMVNPYPEKEQQ